MSNTEYQSQSAVESPRSWNEPVIGFTTTGEDFDAVIRSVLRARQHGYVSLVATTQLSADSIEALLELDVVIVDTSTDTITDSTDESLERTARMLDVPGLIVHRNVDEYIDFHRSLEKWHASQEYVTRSATRDVADGQQTGRTMVAIPAYNEEGSIEAVVKAAKRQVDDVLVVNDGSVDETSRRARDAGAIVVDHDRNRGYGGALKTAFREADSRGVDNLIILDGDDQHDPRDIPKLLSKQRETGAELVVGNRSIDDAETDLPLYRFVGLSVVNLLTNLSLGTVRSDSWIQDTQNGFRAYDARAIHTLARDDTIGDHMDASTDVLYHAKREGYDINEVGVSINYDVDSASSHSPVFHGFVLVRNIFRVLQRERPFLTLGVPGLLSTFLGLWFGYLLLSTVLQTGALSLEYLFVSTILSLAGVLGLITSVVLHALDVWSTE